MNESELRDRIAQDIEVIERGLILLSKEQYIPNPLGTKSFIDLYAKDKEGHHVLIELKKSNSTAREAIHEIYKYVEGVKQHLGARDYEIRVFLASTEWNELLLPFSRFVTDTRISIQGLRILVDEITNALSTEPISVLAITQGRFILPLHDVNWYLNNDSLKKGITSIEACCRTKSINDYVIVILKPKFAVQSRHEAQMRTMLSQMAQITKNLMTRKVPDLPSYEYIAYFAMQVITKERYLQILEKVSGNTSEVRELIRDMDENETIQFLHESVTAVEPRPKQDQYEIGYPAKFISYLDSMQFDVDSIRRYGTFAVNKVLSDNTIISELRGEDGSTRQKFKRTIKVESQADMSSARDDLSKCLEDNHIWKNNILMALDEIQQEFPKAEVDISIYNPSTGVLTLFYPTTRPDGYLYIPLYSLKVRSPGPVRMYYGGIQSEGSPLTFQQILDKYYEGDLWGVLATMSWGGYEVRDIDILEDLGATYRSFRCDITDSKRDFFILQNDRWRSCNPIDVLDLFTKYFEKNESLILQIIKKIDACSIGDGVMFMNEHDNSDK